MKNRSPAFTLIELLVVIAILGLLTSMMTPAIQKVRSQAESTVCVSNLKNIGTAIWLWIPDNGNQYPRIENDPTHPIYEPDDGAKTLYETLKNYGITTNVLACPGDLKNQAKYYAKYTNSYECPPWAGDEAVASGQINFAALPDEDEAAIALLSSIKGIGRWSAEIYLLLAEGRADIFPAGDLALQIQLGRMLGEDARPTEKRARALAEPMRPHRGALSILLWHNYNIVAL